jgi:hypothetical protein
MRGGLALPLWTRMHAETARIGPGLASRPRWWEISFPVIHENDPFESRIWPEVYEEALFDL